MHDADSHIMEEADWLHPYLDAATRERFPYVWSVGDEPGRQAIEKERARHANAEYRAEDESQLMLRKNFSATGSFLNVDRPQALDLLGFSSQLVFDTFTSSPILRFDRDGDAELAVALGTRATPRHPRLVLGRPAAPAGHRAARRRHGRGGHAGPRVIDAGTAAIQIGQYCTPAHSPSHVALDPVWAMCEEAGVPVLLHVAGAGAHVMPAAYFENGRPHVPDFHGGDTNFKSIDYMSIPLPVMQTLNALVIDGVLQRHPGLRIGVIELGASWVPGLDAHARLRARGVPQERRAAAAHGDEAERVRTAAGPGDAVPARGHGLDDREHRTVRGVCSRPTSRTSKVGATRSDGSSAAWTRPAIDAGDRERFYVDNFVDLMGAVLERRGVVTAA